MNLMPQLITNPVWRKFHIILLNQHLNHTKCVRKQNPVSISFLRNQVNSWNCNKRRPLNVWFRMKSIPRTPAIFPLKSKWETKKNYGEWETRDDLFVESATICAVDGFRIMNFTHKHTYLIEFFAQYNGLATAHKRLTLTILQIN